MTFRKNTWGFWTFLALLLAGCNDQPADGTEVLKPPLKPFQVLDPDSLYAKTWPGKPALVKLRDDLVLAIPPQYGQFWRQRHWLTGHDQMYRPPYPLEKLPTMPAVGFVMFMPDFRGYTPDNYLQDFSEDLVLVNHVAPAPMSSLEPGAVGYFPPNALKRLMNSFFIPNPDRFEMKHGLKCYERSPGDTGFEICYGERAQQGEFIILRVDPPATGPMPPYPTMHTWYFSPRLGGVEISWWATRKHFSRWKEIDEQIWAYIQSWNVATRKGWK